MLRFIRPTPTTAGARPPHPRYELLVNLSTRDCRSTRGEDLLKLLVLKIVPMLCRGLNGKPDRRAQNS